VIDELKAAARPRQLNRWIPFLDLKMRRIHKSLLAIVVVGIVLMVALLLYRRMGPLPTLTDRDITGATAITSQWLDIQPAPPLKPSGKTSLVILELKGDYTPDFQAQKLRFPDGSLGMPEMQLVDAQGNIFPLHFLMVHHRDRTGSSVIGGAGFGSPGLPTDRSYGHVRVRSDKSIKCSKVIWRG
jgi:hypothetical protein